MIMEEKQIFLRAEIKSVKLYENIIINALIFLFKYITLNL
jgi:hypothetical protein